MSQGAVEGEKKMKTKAYQGLTDPEHETALRNIRAQSMLHDLVLNDPVISGHDPSEVAQAFNELADVAPQFVDSPAAMQALLRKRLEAGQMADFDVKQLLDMEKARAGSAVAQEEEVARADLPFEYMLNALRLREGFALRDFTERTGLPVSAIAQGLSEAEARGLVTRTLERVQPTERGFDFLSDLQALFLP